MNRLFLFLVFFLATFYGCKTRKLIDTDTADYDHKKIISTLEKNMLHFNTMDARARVSIRMDGSNQNISVDIKIQNDSLIWLSAKVMGLEVGRLFIDKKQITIVDRFNRQFYRYPLTFITDNYAIPYSDLASIQKLLTGGLLFVPDKNTRFSQDTLSYRFERTKDEILEVLLLRVPDMDLWGYDMDYPQKNQRAKMRYSDIIKDKRMEIPKNVEIWAYLPDETYIKLTYFSIRFNEAIEFDTTIPGSYLQAN